MEPFLDEITVWDGSQDSSQPIALSTRAPGSEKIVDCPLKGCIFRQQNLSKIQLPWCWFYLLDCSHHLHSQPRVAHYFAWWQLRISFSLMIKGEAMQDQFKNSTLLTALSYFSHDFIYSTAQLCEKDLYCHQHLLPYAIVLATLLHMKKLNVRKVFARLLLE